MKMFLLVMIILAIGVCIGILFMAYSMRKATFGSLIIDSTDVSKDLLSFEMTTSLDEIINQKMIVLNVVVKK